MRTNVYIDGFNLYYGRLKGSEHLWLDLRSLAKKLLPNDKIGEVHYFTARVKPWPGEEPKDQGPTDRQDVYLRALKQVGTRVHEGRFDIRQKGVAIVDGRVEAWISEDFASRAQSVAVVGGRATAWISEEKGSDVNLASWLLLGAAENRFEKALVVTNDSDLAEPIRIVTERFGRWCWGCHWKALTTKEGQLATSQRWQQRL